jgi:hypothetical protein
VDIVTSLNLGGPDHGILERIAQQSLVMETTLIPLVIKMENLILVVSGR